MMIGLYEIPHPAGEAAIIPDIVLVPTVGFDAACYRLGYGGGYYDRTIAAFAERPITIGVGFEFGRLDTIEPGPHDIPMDMIVTEAGIFRRS
jgi:5-formyltetrahydrofolate cyclo-ligase